MRDNSIDILRFVGLAMIILAHVGPPDILFQLRNFDVPLMVLVSGMAFGLSYKANESYLQFFWKRANRLVLPVWIFLTGYFLSLLLFAPEHSDLGTYEIATSYLLIGGIGYVWIIRVFILVALVSPFIFKWHLGESSNKKYFILLALTFINYEIARTFSLSLIDEFTGKAISLITHYIIPYAIIFAIGLRIPSLKNKQVALISVGSFAALVWFGFGIYLATGTVMPTQEYKYPPSIYYFSYSVFVSTVLWVFRSQIESMLEKIKLKDFVLFCAQNSIWIYLWHIPFVKFVDADFVVKYLAVFSVSVLITFVQVWIVNQIVARVPNTTVQKNAKALFTG